MKTKRKDFGDVINLVGVDSPFKLIRVSNNKSTEVIDKDCLELDEKESKVYDKNSFLFFMDTQEFNWEYVRTDNENIKLNLSYYLCDDEVKEAKDNGQSIDQTVVVNGLMSEPFDYVKELLNGDDPVTVHITHTYCTTSDFIVYINGKTPEMLVDNFEMSKSCKYVVFDGNEYYVPKF